MDNDAYIGQQIGNYRLTEAIASGGFGSVYKAEHIHLSGRIVAIKLLHTYLGSQAERDQFAREAQFLVQLDHPYILSLLDFGFSDGQPYLITRYAAGGSLRQKLKQQKHLPPAQALTILQQVGSALHSAHEHNVIHRDLKPENILFNERDEALLADFGIAVMLSTASVQHLSVITGTPPYMAPEQFKGTISKEGDQYALGCIAYELLTGQPPFRAPDFVSMGFKHLTEPPIPPSQFDVQVSPTTEAAILKALAKQRSERHPDIPTFLADLDEPLMQPITPLFIVSSTSLPTPGGILPTRRADPWIKKQLMQQGNVHFNKQNYAEALAAYEQAICFDPKDATAYHDKGDVLNKLHRYEEALVAYEQAIHLNPKDAIAYNNVGYLLNKLHRYEEALVAYEQAIHLNPQSAMAYNNKGYALDHLHRYEEALAAYEQAIRLDPKDAIYNNKGDTLEHLHRYEEALAAYEQSIHLNPKSAIAYNNEGYILDRLHYYEGALSAFEQAIHLNPNSTIYNNKGNALKALGRTKEAEDAYAKARSLSG